MDLSELKLSLESDSCLMAMGLRRTRHLSAIYRGNRNKAQQMTCSQQDVQASPCLSAPRDISQEERKLSVPQLPLHLSYSGSACSRIIVSSIWFFRQGFKLVAHAILKLTAWSRLALKL